MTITIDERTKRPTCNLAKMVDNKQLQQSGNKMNWLYIATMDDLIRAFMQIVNYRAWLKGGSTRKDTNSTSIKLKVVANSGDPKPLAKAMDPI